MNKLKTIFLLILLSIAISACQTVSKKIEDTTVMEQKELSKWLNKSELELKSFYGQPDNVEFLNFPDNLMFLNFRILQMFKCPIFQFPDFLNFSNFQMFKFSHFLKFPISTHFPLTFVKFSCKSIQQSLTANQSTFN